jgi:hypothetical protein
VKASIRPCEFKKNASVSEKSILI